MTQEEKAKYYDKAVEKLRNAFYGNNSRMRDEYRKAVISIIEPIFPELKESEDEKKPNDKIEPKFKVGDWIVSETSNLVYRVDSILFPQSKCYCLSYNGGTVLINFADEQNYHLWTIQDAKDGDVIVFDNAFILIFKEIIDLKTTLFTKKIIGFYFKSYVNLDFLMNVFEQGSFCYNTGSNCQPATKEQRNLLFTKMKEAGYEWNAEKKELKKIEELNPAENTCKISDCDKVDMTEYINGYECGKQRVLKYPEDYGLCENMLGLKRMKKWKNVF